MIAAVYIVYHLLDGSERVIYVGMTGDIGRRISQHRRTKDWWPDVVAMRGQFFDDYAAAKRAEYREICQLRPEHNHGYPIRQHVPKALTDAGSAR